MDEYTKQQMVVAFEYGFREHEKGNNLQQATINFLKDMDGVGGMKNDN